MSVIALENLSVSHRQGYELRTVVHEVNLRIEPGVFRAGGAFRLRQILVAVGAGRAERQLAGRL